jgi:endonuclease/exonuclease/phosphatase (EEP) superfamily protein YafD
VVDVFLYSCALVVIVATLLPLLRQEAWWIRIFDFPRIQIAVLGVIIIGAELIFRKGSATHITALIFPLLLGACILYQAYMIYPYTFIARKTVKPAKNARPGSVFSLLISNVKMQNRNAAGLTRIIHANDPDVILIVEIDEWWENALKELEQTYPFSVHQPQDNSYGMILFSRLNILDSQVLFRIYEDVPSIRASISLPAGTKVELHCLHPKPPVPQETGSSKQRDAELLIVGRETRGKVIPIVAMGDLNDVAWSHTNYLFQRISGLLDPRIGRGFYNTFDARYPIMRFPLDHFFHSNHFRLVTLKRLPYFGSDHFPMYITLSYEPDAVVEQKPEKPEADDQQEATEKIQSTGGAPT